jgi:hypothetical protein
MVLLIWLLNWIESVEKRVNQPYAYTQTTSRRSTLHYFVVQLIHFMSYFFLRRQFVTIVVHAPNLKPVDTLNI